MNSWRIWAAAAALLGTAAFAPVAGAATSSVDDDRVDCPTAQHTSVQAAIDAAAPGDTIAICPGRYVEGTGAVGTNALTIAKSLTLRGAGADMVRIVPRGARIIEPAPDIRNGVGDIVAVNGGAALPITVNISGVTFDGGGAFVEAGVVFLDAAGTIYRSRVTNVVTSELAADSETKPGAYRGPQFGYGVAHVTAGMSAPAGVTRTLTISQSRIDRYNRAGVLIDGATNDLAPYTPSGVANRGELRNNSIVGRLVCTNFTTNGNCTASGSPGNNLTTTGPLFGQDGVRVTAGAGVALSGNTISQNLVHGSGAPTRGQAANNANLPLGAGVRLVGAGASTATRNNILDNAYGAINTEMDGVTPNTAVPFAAENNWWGLRSTAATLPNAGPAISPTTNPPFPENPVNGASVPDATGTSSTTVDYFPFRNGAQADSTSGQFVVFDVPLPVEDAAPATTLSADKPAPRLGETVVLIALPTDDFGVRSVTFYEGTTVHGSDGLPPYTAKLDIDACSARTLTAVVEDSLGQTASASLAVTADCSDLQPEPTPTPQPAPQTPARPSIGGTLPDLHQGGSIVRVSPVAPAGVAALDFYLGTRRICSLTAAPFACTVKPTGDDIGAQVLRVVLTDRAGQTAETSRTVEIDRFRVKRVRLSVDRLRARVFRLSGRLELPVAVTVSQGCRSGRVTIALKRGAGTVATTEIALRRDCTFSKSVRAPRTGKHTLAARFAGNTVLRPAEADRRLP